MAQWEVKHKDLLHYVEVTLRNETVRTEATAMRYYRGPIEMQSKMPSVGSFIKSRLSGEKVFRPIYTGSGKLVLEPSFQEFYALELRNEELILDKGAYWASDGDVEVDIRMNKISTSLFSGEGWIQTAVRGTGTVIIQAPGAIEVVDLHNDRLVVDGNFAVARSASLSFSIQQSAKSSLRHDDLWRRPRHRPARQRPRLPRPHPQPHADDAKRDFKQHVWDAGRVSGLRNKKKATCAALVEFEPFRLTQKFFPTNCEDGVNRMPG